MKFKLWRRADAALIVKGASEVESAYLAWAAQMAEEYGYDPEEYTPTQYALERIGTVAQGVLWRVCDSMYYWPSVFILDAKGGAEVFLAKSKDGNELLMSETLTELDFDLDAVADDDSGAELLKVLKGQEPQPTYTIVKATQLVKDGEAPQQYTLGIAYPASDGTVRDSHGDYATESDLEQAAWDFMRSGQVLKAGSGTDHAEGTDLSGTPVESYIYRGPDWLDEDGEAIAKSGDWMLGVVWSDDAWARIESGELTGFSIQGVAVVEDD